MSGYLIMMLAGGLLLLPFAISLYDSIRGTAHNCRIFGWHKPSSWIEHIGVNQKSSCAKCNKPILRDSQGNWFAVPTTEGEK